MEGISIVKETAFARADLLVRGSFEVLEMKDGQLLGTYEMGVFIGEKHASEVMKLTRAFVSSLVAFIEQKKAEGSIEDTEAVH